MRNIRSVFSKLENSSMTGSDDTQIADQFLYSQSPVSDATPLISKGKTVPYITDISNTSYSTGQITFDGTTAFNSSGNKFCSLRDAYIVVPYVVSVKNIGAGNLTGAITNQMLGLKTGVHNIIDKISLELNGKTILTQANYLNIWNNIRVQTEWSAEDLQKQAASSLLYPDEVLSAAFTTSGTSATGDGFSNNLNNPGTALTAPTATQLTPLQSYNTGFWKRTQANPLPALAFNWTVLSSTALQSTARGAFVAGARTSGSLVATFCHMLKIRLVDLHPVFKTLDLTQNPQIKLQIQTNTGSAVIGIPAASQMTLGSVNMVSSSTCLVMMAAATGGLNALVSAASAATSLRLQWGPIQTTDCGSRAAYFPFTATRLYIPTYDLVNPLQLLSVP